MITLANKIPVNPPKVKVNKKPIIKNKGALNCILEAQRVDTQLNILIPVGIAITVVAVVK